MLRISGLGRAAALLLLGMVVASAEAHPFLADAPENRAWHASQKSGVVVYTGDGSATPVVALKKSALAGNTLTLAITSDATRCELHSGAVTAGFPLVAQDAATLVLDGAADPPALTLDGKPLPAVQGKWIQICSQAGDTPVAMSFVGGSYVTLKVSSGADGGAAVAGAAPADSSAAPAAPASPDLASTVATAPKAADDALSAQSAADALTLAKHGVFKLQARNAHGEVFASGSGFLINGLGRAVTCYHVIRNAASATATFADHESEPVRVDLLAVLPEFDLALIRLHLNDAADAFPAAMKLATVPPAEGQEVFALGYPEFGYTVNRGVVNGVREFDQMPAEVVQAGFGYAPASKWIQTDCTINHGNSGGPLVDGQGRVLGVNAWYWAPLRNAYFAVSGSHLAALTATASSTPIPFTPAGDAGPQQAADTAAVVPSLVIGKPVDAQTVVATAADFANNGLFACAACNGTGVVHVRSQVGYVQQGYVLVPTYADRAVSCVHCQGTGRDHAGQTALEQMTKRFLTALAAATEDAKFSDKLPTLAEMLRRSIAADTRAQFFFTEQTRAAADNEGTKPLDPFIATGRITDSIPSTPRTPQLFALYITGCDKLVLVAHPKLMRAAVGDAVIVGGLFAGRMAAGGHDYPVLENGFVIRSSGE